MSLIVSRASLQYVIIPVDIRVAGITQDPTAYAAQMAFPAPGSPPVDWQAAIWDTDNTGPDPLYSVLCLIGPGGTIVLTPGKYQPYIQVAGTPEIPAIPSPNILEII